LKILFEKFALKMWKIWHFLFIFALKIEQSCQNHIRNIDLKTSMRWG
jgi:hypothetical protein